MNNFLYRCLQHTLAIGLLLVIAVTPAYAKSKPPKDDLDELRAMSDQFDEVDKQDLQTLLNKANDCTRARNFSCSEEQLRKAGKLANGSRDKQALNSAQQNLQSEKNRVEQEARDKAERERQIRLAEEREQERAREAERERRREESRNSPSTAQLLAGALGKMGQDLGTFNQQMAAQNEETNRLYRQALQRKQAERDAQIREENDRRESELRRQQALSEMRARDEQRQNQLSENRQQEQTRQQEQEQKAAQARKDEQARQQEQARKEEQARRDEQARKEEQARKQADAEAARLAEKKAEQQAERDYLSAMRSGIRLGVRNCYGSYEVAGTKPKINSTVDPCVDVYFRAHCEGGAELYSGVIKTFIGQGAGCFGETGTLSPKPDCPANQVQARVEDVRICGH